MEAVKVVEHQNQTFGMKLEEIRLERGLSRTEFSELVKLSYQKVYNWEKNRIEPFVTDLEKMAKILNISISELVNEKEVLKFRVTRRDLPSKTFGDRLKIARLQKEFTQKELAKQLEVTLSTICRWEDGRCTPTLSNAQKISIILGAPLDFLIQGRRNRPKKDFKHSDDVLTDQSIPSRETLMLHKEEFIKRLKKVRQDHQISAFKLAEVLEVSSNLVYRWEDGTALPSVKSLRKMLNYFEMTYKEFMNDLSAAEELMGEIVEDKTSLIEDITKVEEALANPVESVSTEEAPLNQEIETIHSVMEEASRDIDEVIRILTDKVISKVEEISKQNSELTSFTEEEVLMIEKIRQLDQEKIGMLQSYLDYLMCK